MPGSGSDDIKLDLDPASVLKALQDMKAEFTGLADHVEQQLGKKAPQAISSLEESAKNGTNKITEYFRNLGTRVRDDLKTAFDATGILGGAKFAKDLGEGVRQTFELERAFDRLNVRLKKSNTEMAEFKTQLGRRVANTGASMADVLPGVETAASRGNVRSTGDLASIGETLGRVNQTTGESTNELSETVVEILKNQGQKVTAESFKATVDALQGARVNGAFTNAEEAGRNVEALSKFAPTNKMNVRELGAISATASQGGSQGNNILQQMLAKGGTAGGQAQMNAVFGRDVFKNGKLEASEIGKIDTGRLGQYSMQNMAGGAELEGANGADLKRFIEAFRDNMGSYKKVIAGANETSAQFDVATDNLASKLDRFKQNVMRSAGEVGRDLSAAGNHMLKGEIGQAVGSVASAGGKAYENKGSIIAAAGITAAVGLIAGRGMNGLLGKLGGGVAKGAAAKAAGVEPVYVVNASEIGGSLSEGVGESFSSKLGGILKSGKLGSMALAAGGTALAAGAAGAVGYGIGTVASKGIDYVGGESGYLGSKAYDWMYPDEKTADKTTDQANMPTADAIGQAVATAFQQTGFKPARPEFINKSAVQGTGKGI